MPEPVDRLLDRRVRIRLDSTMLRQILTLPREFRILTTWADHDPASITLLAVHPALEPQPQDSEAPLLAGSLNQRIVSTPWGVYYRFAWSPQGDAATAEELDKQVALGIARRLRQKSEDEQHLDNGHPAAARVLREAADEIERRFGA